VSIGGHHSAAAKSTTWLTPPGILDALGTWEDFDLDPCAAPAPRPWPTAWRMNAEADGDGLAMEWEGRVWLNPPYGAAVGLWLAKMAAHGKGTALIFARTETESFQRHVWGQAHGLLFLHGRLFFHDRHGVAASHNAGAPSVLCAYGVDDMDRLAMAELPGAFVPLRFARFVLVAGLDQSWREAMRDFLRKQSGPVSVSDAYRYFARSPKAERNRNWRAKVRQQLQTVGRRVGPAQYVVG
jgi:hypothetical protein